MEYDMEMDEDNVDWVAISRGSMKRSVFPATTMVGPIALTDDNELARHPSEAARDGVGITFVYPVGADDDLVTIEARGFRLNAIMACDLAVSLLKAVPPELSDALVKVLSAPPEDDIDPDVVTQVAKYVEKGNYTEMPVPAFIGESMAPVFMSDEGYEHIKGQGTDDQRAEGMGGGDDATP